MIFACIFASIFMVIGATELIYNYILKGNTGIFYLLHGGIFLLVGLSTCYATTVGTIPNRKRWFIYNQQNLDWYKQNYPQFVHSTNVIQCCFCKNNLIKGDLIRNRTYKIRNYCAKCGEVLFYSDEN